MENLASYVAGVLTGVGVSAASYFCKHVFLGVLSKLLGVFQKEGRSIRGTWSTKFWIGKQAFDEVAEVHQLGKWVWGRITYAKAGKKVREYSFKGDFKESVLVATYELVKPKRILDRGAFTLKHEAGNELAGGYAWTDDAMSGKIRADTYKWEFEE